MKSMRKLTLILIAMLLAIATTATLGEGSGVVRLPADTIVIEAEAFCGASAIDEVVLPEGATVIGSRAFADSTLTKINLPASLTEIAADAFDGCDGLILSAPAGSYAYGWAADAGFFLAAVSAPEGEYHTGDSVTWTASAVNGVDDCAYLFEVYLDGAKVYTRAYGSDPSCTYTFAQEGVYSVLVKVRDGDRRIVTAEGESLAITARPLVLTLEASDTAPRTTDTVTWTASAENGTAPYAYAFELLMGDTALAAQESSDAPAFSWTFETPGQYTLNVSAEDAAGKKATHAQKITVSLRPLEITGVSCTAETLLTGDPIEWRIGAVGGLSPLSYTYALSIDGEAQAAAESAESAFACTPAAPGEYVMTITVTDAQGTTATVDCEPLTVSLRPLKALSLTASADHVQTGRDVSWTIEAEGGLMPLKYAFDVLLNGETIDSTSYSASSAYTYTPDSTGEYSAIAYVRDSEKTELTLEGGAVSVYAPLRMVSVSSDAAEAVPGDLITWTAETSGGWGEKTFRWDVYRDDSVMHSGQTTIGDTLVYAVNTAGEYHVTVTAADEDGNTAQAGSEPVSVAADDACAESDFTYTVTDETVAVTAYTGSETRVTVPASIGGYPVVSVGLGGNSLIETVALPDSVTELPAGAFQGCTALRSITIPSGVTVIPGYCFDGCATLAGVTLHDGVAQINGYAFQSCAKLKEVLLPEGVQLYTAAFCGCTGLKRIELPDSVTHIHDYTFQDCSSLTYLGLPDTLTYIGHYAILGCTSLKSITVPDTLQSTYPYSPVDSDLVVHCSIDSSAARALGKAGKFIVDPDCPDYRVVVNSDSVGNASLTLTAYTGAEETFTFEPLCGFPFTDMDSAAFNGLTTLKSVVIPEGFSAIPCNAFGFCTGLESTVLPDSITAIHEYAFRGCSALTGVEIPHGVTTIGYKAFAECSALESIVVPENAVNLSGRIFEDCSGLKEAVIEAAITSVPNGTFRQCRALERVVLPDNVTVIEDYAFSGCTKLVLKVTEGSSLHECCAKQGLAYTFADAPDAFTFRTALQDDGTLSVTGVTGTPDAGLVIPDAILDIPVGAIGDAAFRECGTLTGVVIPDGVTAIGSNAFYLCTELTDVRLPSTLTSIGSFAFSGCESLTELFIPTSVADIGSSAFGSCPSLTLTVIEGSYAHSWCTDNGVRCTVVPDYAAIYTFEELADGTLSITGYTGSDTDVVFPAAIEGQSVTQIAKNIFLRNASITSVVVPEGVTFIGEQAFRECSALTSVSLPGTVSAMGSDVFTECTALTHVSLADGMTTLGNFAFYACISLQEISLPDSLTTIGQNAFGRTALTSVSLPDSLSVVTNRMFNACTSLRSVRLPANATTIGYNAFAGCTALTDITLPDTLTSIGFDVFRNCSSLASLTIPKSVTSIGSDVFSGCTSLTVTVYENSVAHTYCTDNGVRCTVVPDYATRYTIETLEDGTLSLSAYCGAETEVVVPAEIDGVPVSAIAADTFRENASITSASLPEGLTSVGSYAFYNCTALTTANLPESLQSVGVRAFSGCSALSGLTVPGELPSIGVAAFYGVDVFCEAGSGAAGRISASGGSFFDPSEPEHRLWQSTSALDGVTRLTYYGPRASVSELVIPDSVNGVHVAYLKDNLFRDNADLTSVTLPSSLLSIGTGAFQRCTGLTSIVIPDSVQTIKQQAFHSCSALTDVTVSGQVALIDMYAFAYCTALKTITLPESVTEIGRWAFSNDTALERVILGGNVTAIADDAFLNCAKHIFFCEPFTATTSALSSAGLGFFRHVDAPEYLLSGNATAQTISISGYLGEDTVLVFPAELLGCPVVSVSGFSGNTAITAVTLPDSISSIPSWAFRNCTALTRVTLPETIMKLGEEAFSGCTVLTDINLPDGLTTLGSYALSNTGLAEITLPDGITSVGTASFGTSRVFAVPGSVTAATLSAASVSFYSADAPDYALAQNTAGDGTVGLTLKRYDGSASKLTLPASIGGLPVTAIWNSMFKNNITLTRVVVPGSIASVSHSAFYGCTSLAAVVLESGVTALEPYAFCDCSALTDVTLPGTLTDVGASAFRRCTALKRIVLPEGVTTIGGDVFMDCTALTELWLPASATTFSAGVYSDHIAEGCPNVTAYIISGSPAQTYCEENGIPNLPQPTDEE